MTDDPKSESVLMKNGWVLLVIAGLFEPLWVVSMKMSNGFNDMVWAGATLVLLFFSMYFLALALKTRIPIGTAYAIWVGIGAIGAIVAGIILFGESSEPMRLGFVALIIAGIAGLQFTSRNA